MLPVFAATPDSVNAILHRAGIASYRTGQVLSWIYGRGVTDPDAMTNLPRELRAYLRSELAPPALEVVRIARSHDGTRKMALRLADGELIESVLIPDRHRLTLCVSSQVGCAMGCAFCATARLGLRRHLRIDEIVGQVMLARRHLEEDPLGVGHLTNLVFMGMGEPLHNLENVARACETLNAADGFGIGKAHITVSTSGVVPKIREWAERAPDFKLAVSLNGSNNEIRSALMPVNRRWNIENLLAAADEYIALTGQKLTFEYILIKDRTCTPEAARELKRIAAQRNCKINLIPLNKGEDPALQPPPEEEILAFEAILRQGDFEVLRRRPRGPDILAACGQLAIPLKKVA